MTQNQRSAEMPPVMILCGGKGTRLRDVTELLPKPMVPIGDQPIVWHIMKRYAAFGVRRFILCLGYKREDFIDYFLNFRSRSSDVTVTLGRENRITYHDDAPEADWEVTLAHTGDESKTATRIRLASRHLRPGDRDFFLTYGDGLSDIDIAELLRFHRRQGKKLTISAVVPEGRFGEMRIEGNIVRSFEEKVSHRERFINGGFMVADAALIQPYIPADEDHFFEAEPMQRLMLDGELAAYRHEGFWQCMDTAREYQYLNELWKSGHAPWVAAERS